MFTVDAKELRSAAHRVLKSTDKRGAAWANNAYFTFKDGKLSIGVNTGAILTVTNRIPVILDEEPKPFAVNAKMLYESIKGMSKRVRVRVEGNNVIVNDGVISAFLDLENSDYFEREPMNVGVSLRMNVKNFRNMIKPYVKIALRNNSIRPLLRSIELKGNSLTATDGYHLLHDTLLFGGGVETNVLIDARGVKTALSVLTGLSGEVFVRCDDGLVELSCGNVLIHVLALEGRYPDYTDVFNKPITRFLCKTAELLEVFKKLSKLDNTIVKVVIDEGVVDITSLDGETISVVEHRLGDCDSFHIDAKLFKNVLEGVTEDRVTFGVNDGTLQVRAGWGLKSVIMLCKV